MGGTCKWSCDSYNKVCTTFSICLSLYLQNWTSSASARISRLREKCLHKGYKTPLILFERPVIQIDETQSVQVAMLYPNLYTRSFWNAKHRVLMRCLKGRLLQVYQPKIRGPLKMQMRQRLMGSLRPSRGGAQLLHYHQLNLILSVVVLLLHCCRNSFR